MQPNPTRPSLDGSAGYVSERRFPLLLLLCAVALAVMLAPIYHVVGSGSTRAGFAVPAA